MSGGCECSCSHIRVCGNVCNATAIVGTHKDSVFWIVGCSVKTTVEKTTKGSVFVALSIFLYA